MAHFDEVNKAWWDYFCGKYGQPKYKTTLQTNTFDDEYYEFDVDGRNLAGKIRKYKTGGIVKYYMWR